MIELGQLRTHYLQNVMRTKGKENDKTQKGYFGENIAQALARQHLWSSYGISLGRNMDGV